MKQKLFTLFLTYISITHVSCMEQRKALPPHIRRLHITIPCLAKTSLHEPPPCSPSQKDESDGSPLITIILTSPNDEHCLEAARAYLQQHAHISCHGTSLINFQDKFGRTALMWALERKFPLTAVFLTSQPFNPWIRDQYGYSYWMYGAQYNGWEMFLAFTDALIDDLFMSNPNRWMDTLLHINEWHYDSLSLAAACNSLEFFTLLTNLYAHVSTKTAYHHHQRCPSWKKSQRSSLYCALREALIFDHLAIALFLLGYAQCHESTVTHLLSTHGSRLSPTAQRILEPSVRAEIQRMHKVLTNITTQPMEDAFFTELRGNPCLSDPLIIASYHELCAGVGRIRDRVQKLPT